MQFVVDGIYYLCVFLIGVILGRISMAAQFAVMAYKNVDYAKKEDLGSLIKNFSKTFK
ncbi:hypothetical protein JW930_07245 [Candidatus Woesearchaeota archaeon]|nr:hypothetical protein [Candidatus Woesearchaeota archaeon]